MNRAMVGSANTDQVLEFRLTALCPVMEMVSINNLMSASRKPTAAIAHGHGSPNRRRNRSRLPTDIQSLAGSIAENRNHARVAKKSTARLRRNNGSLGGGARQIACLDMKHHFGWISPRQITSRCPIRHLDETFAAAIRSRSRGFVREPLLRASHIAKHVTRTSGTQRKRR